MKWTLLHDRLFHNPTGEWVTLKKGSVYDEVHFKNQDPDVIRAVKNNQRRSRFNAEYVVLDAEGLQRLFVIGKDVARHISSSKKFKRIRRRKTPNVRE